MLYSKTAKQNSASGFFFDSDKNAPDDAIKISNEDANTAINLPSGATFDFSLEGALVVSPAPERSADEIAAEEQARSWSKYQAAAQSALEKSDAVALRCWKAGVDYPTAWRVYDAALREIVRAKSGDDSLPLPEQPAYPEGT